jgi:hypothetical protein
MNRLTEEEKVILQEEVSKITDILEKEDLSDEKRQYLKELKKCMMDRKRGFRKPVKNAEKEAFLQSVCDKILKNRLKKGGVNHNLSLVKGRLPPVAVDKKLEKKQNKFQNEFIRKRMIMMKKTLKNQKLPTIPEYKGGKKKSASRKTRKNKH